MSDVAHIEVKKDIDHIRLRPGMYIGATYDPNHLLQEIIDNSLDELINNYCDKIEIFFISDSHVVVTDNGRGIPVHEIELENGIKELSLITASTRLKSGAKFDNSAYHFSIGLHGIGLVAVNALSKQMRISVKDVKNNIIHDVYFINAELQYYQTYSLDSEEIDTDIDWSTRVEFEVDPIYFTIPTFTKTRVLDQLKLTSAKFPKAKLYLDGTLIQIPSLESLVREKLELDNSIPLLKWNFKTTTNVKTYEVDSENKVVTKYVPKSIEFDCYYTYDLDSAASTLTFGDVNLRACTGRYLTNFTTLYANCVLNKYNVNLTRNEILSNFRLYISLIIPDPEFDSQSKSNMSKDIKYVLDKGISQLTGSIGHVYIKQCLDQLVDKKALKKVTKKIKKRSRVSSKNPLRDCLQTPGKTLWLLEGDSAMGGLMKIRNTRTEGVYPLTGKILNVVAKNLSQVSESKKFKYLFEALGAEPGNKKQTNYRFEEIKILCDADPDGHHIVVLLLMGIWYYFPYFLLNRKVTIILPPLYGAYNGKQFIPIYNTADLSKFKTHRRYKGIGEMNADELEVIIRGKGVEYIPEPPQNQAQANNLIQCLDDTELKRKLCLDVEHFNIEKMFPSSQSSN